MLPEGKRGCGQAYSCCCGKIICCGCWYAHESCNMDNTCPFCRAPTPDTVERFLEKLNRRTEVNDAEAYFRLGTGYMKGNKEMKVAQDREKGLKFWLRAGELGSAKAYRQLGCVYMNGDGGVEKDEKKGRHFHELAAIGGNARSRHILGVIEHQAGNMEKSIKHHMIAARLGHTGSLNQIKQSFLTGGGATRDDYLQSLRSYQQYVEEARSAQRDVAAASHETYKYLEE
jgi:TPR repeat protein